MPGKEFSFGSKPRMKEVPPGAEAIFTFKGDPEIIETDYGEKYSFPISLNLHPSYPILEALEKEGNPEPMDMAWESKSQCAKQLYNDLIEEKGKYHKELVIAYKERHWRLSRFDAGSYWLDVLPRGNK